MKFLILFLCISSFQLSANVYSQIAKVSLEVKNASLEQVIQLLEKESGYIFLYEDAQIEQVQDLELNFKDEDLKFQVLIFKVQFQILYLFDLGILIQKNIARFFL